VQTTLRPMPPFDFAKSLAFIDGFRPISGDQKITAHQLTKAVRIEGQTIGFEVKAVGTLEAPELQVTLHATCEISPQIQAAALDRIAFFLSIADDLRPFYALADEPFQPIVEQLYGYHQVKFLTPFENAVWAILTTRQQMSVASKIKARLTAAFGGKININGQEYLAFPSPTDILQAPPDELQQIIGNERRVMYVLAAAQAFAGVDETFLRTGTVDEVRKWLLNIKGIGAWSASFILIRALGRMEILDVPEARLIEAAARRYGAGLDAVAVLNLAARYGAYRGYWALYVRAGGS